MGELRRVHSFLVMLIELLPLSNPEREYLSLHYCHAGAFDQDGSKIGKRGHLLDAPSAGNDSGRKKPIECGALIFYVQHIWAFMA